MRECFPAFITVQFVNDCGFGCDHACYLWTRDRTASHDQIIFHIILIDVVRPFIFGTVNADAMSLGDGITAFVLDRGYRVTSRIMVPSSFPPSIWNHAFAVGDHVAGP